MFKYFIPALLFLFACQETYKADYEVKTELQLIDTLQNQLHTVKTWLDFIKLEEIQERKEIVNHNFDYIVSRLKEKEMIADEQTVQLLDQYKRYGKLYDKAAESYKPVVVEIEELLIQLKTLKESAHSKDYEKETFIKYFQKEREDVEKLYGLADSVLKPLKEIDLPFERAQKEVEALAESLKD